MPPALPRIHGLARALASAPGASAFDPDFSARIAARDARFRREKAGATRLGRGAIRDYRRDDSRRFAGVAMALDGNSSAARSPGIAGAGRHAGSVIRRRLAVA